MALAGLLMASCSDDNDPFTGGGGSNAALSRQLTFVFPGTAQGVVPYSAAASEAENALETLDIYVFGEDTLDAKGPMVLEEIFRSGQGYELSTNGDAKTATISAPAGNNKAFFFVANGREHLSLDSLVLHETDTTAFKQKMSNTLKGHIACPMLMSAQVNMPDVATTLAGGNSVDVTLVRRMARFDIQNNSETSSFVIQTVVLDNVPANVPLFPMEKYDVPVLEKLPIIDFTALANSNAGEVNSVFYLYPTTKTSGADGLILSLAGKDLVTNAAQVLPVEFKNYRTEEFISIEANNRYLIQVQDLGSGELTATLTVKEWISGDTVNVDMGDGTIKLSSENAGFADNTLLVAAEPTLTDSVQIDVAADGEWTLLVDTAAMDWIGVSEVKAGEVLKSFKVTTLLPNPSRQEMRHGVVMVQNVRRPSIRQPLIIKQEKNTERYLDLTGAAVAGNLLSFSGEKKTGDSLNVTVSAPDGVAWTATKGASADWFTFGNESGLKAAADDGSKFEGTGTATFSIAPQANTTELARVDTVTITIAQAGEYGTDLVQKLVVRQAARNLGSITVACIGLSQGNVNIKAAGFSEENGLRQVKVKATTEWKVVIPTEASWLTLEKVDGKDYTVDDGTYNGYFMLKAAAQAQGAEARSAEVTIQNTLDPTISQKITFTQAAGEAAPVAPTITLSDDAVISGVSIVQTGNEASPAEITVTCSSGSWTVSNDSEGSWLTTTKGTDTDADKIIISAAAFDGGSENRSATVTVTSSEDSNVTATFTVTQAFE